MLILELLEAMQDLPHQDLVHKLQSGHYRGWVLRLVLSRMSPQFRTTVVERKAAEGVGESKQDGSRANKSREEAE